MAPPSTLSVLLSFFLLLFYSSVQSETTHLPSDYSSGPVPHLLGKFAKRNDKLQEQLKQYRYEIRYFTQRLDHFSFSDAPTFLQRYLISTEHWTGADRTGPIFMYCGNEGDIEWFAANTGFVWEIAPRFGALVLFPEHRYYGDSMPYGSHVEAYKNATTLSHLTAEQALADYAVLLRELKRNLSAEACPVVLFGGSYGGMLAAWMRLKYPHVAIGALASSAPILQFEDIVPPETFYDLVSNDFRRESISCFNTIKESWNVLAFEGQNVDGLLQLTKTFHLCRDLNNIGDLSDWLESAYSYLAMVNYPYPSEFLMPLPANPVKELCRKIDGAPDGTRIMDRIFDGVSVYYNYTGSVKCFELDDDPHGMNGWNWQACTEMVMPMSSSQDNSMFRTYDYNYTSFQEWCWKSFKAEPRPRWITTEFGGHDFKTRLKTCGSNIIFANGLLDPWSGGSVLQNVSDTIIALVTDEGAHHLDLRASTDDDPDWLIQQRRTEINLIEGRRAKSMPIFNRRILGSLLDFAARELQVQTKVVAATTAENAIVIVMLVEDHLQLQSELCSVSSLVNGTVSPLACVPPASNQLSSLTMEDGEFKVTSANYKSLPDDAGGLPVDVLTSLANGNGQTSAAVMKQLTAASAAEPYDSVSCAFVTYGSCAIDLVEGESTSSSAILPVLVPAHFPTFIVRQLFHDFSTYHAGCATLVGATDSLAYDDRILREVATLFCLQHQHVVCYYHAWFETDVAGFLEGGTWDSRTPVNSSFSCKGRSSPDMGNDVVDLLHQIVEGLAHINGQGIIQHELTPNNIFVNTHHDIMIGDFGLAKFLKFEQLDQDHAFLSDALGVSMSGTDQIETYFYTATEIEQGWPEIYEKDDLYRLGVVFFKLGHPFKTAMGRHICNFRSEVERTASFCLGC
ncbi:hypothetical protein Nepgr_026467 [Nepenthes gracilis]|uniref:Protein kinase domain-containing protein n=1 Tax=Nepenthes gracilis TaxID=150966 RepID=A0AAD3T8H4_NEPGR|nr:hypothetical protein Nepgr_026467 [Nepenthes gracilis]